jgi:tetratricopeptide (TPR) repeat protein
LRLKGVSSRNRILAQPVSSFNLDEILNHKAALPTASPAHQRTLQEQKISSIDKEIVMRSFLITLVVAAFSLCFATITTGQTPSNAINLYKHGTSKLNKNDLDGAIEDFTKAIELSSRLGPAKADNGSRFKNDLTTEAEAGNITVIDPLTANAYSNRGVARMRKGDFEGAIQDFGRAIRIRPNQAEPYLNRCAAKRAIGDRMGALADADKAISLDDQLYQAYNNRASVRFELADYEGAHKDLNRAIELNPKIVEHFYNRGYLLVQQGQFDAALQDFNEAVKLNPAMAQPYQGRATAWMKKAKYDEAIADLTRAIEIDPTEPTSYMNRGLSLTVKGRETEAKKDFDKCLELNPALKEELEQKMTIAKSIRYALIND